MKGMGCTTRGVWRAREYPAVGFERSLPGLQVYKFASLPGLQVVLKLRFTPEEELVSLLSAKSMVGVSM